MHIQSVYLSTYNPTTPISGRMTVKTNSGEVQMDIPTDICHSLQNSLVAAWTLRQQELAREILAETPALVALAPPEPSPIEEAVFTDVADFEEIF